MFLNFRTDRSGQTVLGEQSDQGLHCLPFRLHHLKIGPHQENLVLIAYASSEGSGEHAHPRSLARTSAARSYKQ